MRLSALMSVSYVGLWLVVIVQTLVLLEVLRQIGILRSRLGDEPGALLVDGEGLERGTRAPGFSASEVLGGNNVTDLIFAGKMTLLVFLTTRCEACRDLVPHLGKVRRDYLGDAQIVAFCSGPGTECSSFVQETRPDVTMLFDRDQKVMEAYQVKRSPSATLVDRNGIVRLHAIANDWKQLAGILEEEVSVSGSEWLLLEQKEEEPVRLSSWALVQLPR